jgi:ABC-type polysaccharide/polyol phosphate transport system ATPase subunit
MSQLKAVVNRQTETSASGALVRLENAGIRYRLLTHENRTLKGRVMNLLRGHASPEAPFWALRGATFSAAPGDVVGLVGPNGAGKSSLLRLIAGVLSPSEGTVEVRGAIRPLLDLMGPLNGELTGRENCYLYGALNRIPRAEMDRLIPRIVDFSELGTFFDVPIKCYSAGMAARLAFSLATLLKPEILLVDEVLSVGDEHFQKKSYFRMLKLIEGGAIVIIASHNLSFLEEMCSKVILLERGKVQASGRPREVIAQYRRSLA